MLAEILRTPDPDEKFRKLCLHYSALLAKEGIRAIPFHSGGLTHFTALPPQAKNEAIAQISETLSVFEAVLSEGFSLRDNSRLMWRALRSLKLRPESDFFDKVLPDDVLVIFSPQLTQLFQDLNYWHWVSTTIEQVYATPVWNYSQRDPAIIEKLMALSQRILTGELKGTISGVPEHLVEEVGTEELTRFKIEVPFACPVYRDTTVAGILAINRCRDLEVRRPATNDSFHS